MVSGYYTMHVTIQLQGDMDFFMILMHHSLSEAHLTVKLSGSDCVSLACGKKKVKCHSPGSCSLLITSKSGGQFGLLCFLPCFFS